MANSESNKSQETPYPGAYHPAAFYVPASEHHLQQVSTGVQGPVHPAVDYGDRTQGWITLALVILVLALLVDWMWRNRH